MRRNTKLLLEGSHQVLCRLGGPPVLPMTGANEPGPWARQKGYKVKFANSFWLFWKPLPLKSVCPRLNKNTPGHPAKISDLTACDWKALAKSLPQKSLVLGWWGVCLGGIHHVQHGPVV